MKDGEEIANSLLGKLRQFVSTQLDDEESEMFASLLAPGVALAYGEEPRPDEQSDEVVVFAASATSDEELDGPPLYVTDVYVTDAGTDVQWRPSSLSRALGGAIRESGLRVVGLE